MCNMRYWQVIRLNFFVGKLMNYAEANLEMSRFEAAKLRFMLEVIFLMVVDYIIIGTFFLLLGLFTEFVVITVVLMSLRTLAGGLHVKNYVLCFFITLAVYISAIMILPDISGTRGVLEALLAVSILLNISFAPVSKRNSAHSPRSNLIFKLLSTAVIAAYAVFVLVARDNPYVSMIVWLIFFQSLQLIVGKVAIRRELAKKQ